MNFDILVIDDNRTFYNQLKDKFSEDVDLRYFSDVTSFYGHVAEFHSRVACVFFGLSCFKQLETSFGRTYKDLLDTRSIILLEDDIEDIQFPRSLKRSIPYLELQQLLAPLVDSLALKMKSSVGAATEFIPIKAAEFVSGSQSIFDVFVKLSDKKYVKIVNAGDAFNPQRVNEYISKGVEYFYIPRESHAAYLRFSDKVAAAVLKKKELPVEVKASMTFKHGEEILAHLSAFGCSPEVLSYGKKFVENLSLLLRDNLSTAKHDVVRSFLHNVAALEHGTGVAVVAGVLAKELGICSDNPFKTVGLAALFHDISLYEMGLCESDFEIRKNDPQWMSLFLSHPDRSAQILEKIGGFNPVVIQAIQQHHMRSKGRGFPVRLPGTITHKLAEIIGIADEFASLVKNGSLSTPETLLTELDYRVFPGFSGNTVTAFKNAFFPKKTAKIGKVA